MVDYIPTASLIHIHFHLFLSQILSKLLVKKFRHLLTQPPSLLDNPTSQSLSSIVNQSHHNLPQISINTHIAYPLISSPDLQNMGNANGREEDGGNSINIGNVHDYLTTNTNPVVVHRITSSDSMGNSPPQSPPRSVSPLMFNPQLPVAPLRRDDGTLFHNDMWQTERLGAVDQHPEKGIPTVILWSLGGNNVAVEGSWDNWTSRKILRRSGKDHAVLLVLPSGIYHYKFIVDGETRYSPDLPHVSSEMGHVCNVLNVHDYVPENLDSVAEFEAPASPESSYNRAFPGEDDFAKEPMIVPPQLQLTVLGMDDSDDAASSRPQHVVLNHLFIEKGWAASQSVVALGLTHRFQSKYVTVLLYKPVRR